MTTRFENLSPAETAREIMCDLGEAARAVGVQFPSLRLDPHPVAGLGAPAHLIETGRINLTTAMQMTEVFRAARP
ncbi:hypothetical protein A6A06_33945 [Streptomyces sp. CB02923]|uniref:hypothetical protein n=1 Tax=Streptomyces sp. CB02923 TaxID=1718985 RepID=UPI00093CF35B|nr:hypothetical protein [Streptomyces sp. CB02923]OKI08270.1 hypothetical protein A6A06_33945 [Streptomyces sp. CB02923]